MESKQTVRFLVLNSPNDILTKPFPIQWILAAQRRYQDDSITASDLASLRPERGSERNIFVDCVSFCVLKILKIFKKKIAAAL